MSSKTRPESDRDRQTPMRPFGELMTVKNQDAELFSQEFPEGAYGAAPAADRKEKKTLRNNTGVTKQE